MSNIIITAELAAACNALGTYDPKTKIYLADNNIIETVKDIIRYLKKDTESHDFRRFFGDAKIVQLNLIPLLIKYWQQTDLFDVVIRVLGNLTSPVMLLYNEEIPKEKTVRNHFLQILGHLQTYKEALDDVELWAVLCTRLSKLLNIEWHERGTENSLIIERILILVRNVLSIPADPDAEKRPDNDVSAHDKVLWALRTSGLVDIFHYMVSSDQEESYYLYLLEILSLMLREHRPLDLANAASVRTETEKAQDEAEFLSIRRKEMARKNERFRSYTSARHSNFGGTFVFKNVKSVNDSQELIYHKALNKANVLDLDSDKSKVKVPKNRAHLHESPNFRRSTFSIRLLLKHFCIEFLNSGYNKLMQNVRGKLVRGKSVSHDETYYLWALRFFMEFNRHYKFDVKLVSETMSIQIFHYVQQQMEHNFDMVTSDKKKWYLWSKRLHLAVQAYKELLLNLAQMDKSSDRSIRESAKVIKSNVFYVLEYREFLLTLMLTYNPQKMSDAYLLDLIETQHIFMKMLEAFCGKETSIVVQKRQKIKKKKSQAAQEAGPVISLEETLEIKWDEISPQLSAVLDGGENIPELAPFDAASEVPIDDQKKDAMIKIQDYLRDNEIENAIGLLRAARNVWPDNDSFGSSSMTPEEEFLAIREIFFAKLRDEQEKPPPPNYFEENEEDEEDEQDIEIEREVDLKFIDFATRFAHPKVIQALGLALRHFETNTVHVNHCILKLLHRIAWDCKMPAMLFQASIFRTFQQIFAERKQPQYKELVKFAIYVVRQFVKVAEKNQKVFMELLFWKNSKEAYETEEGYGSYQTKSKAMKAAWTEQEEDELRVLVMEYREKEIEEDAVDWLMKNLIDNTKTRRMIIKKLKELMLMDYKGPKKSGSGSGVMSSRVSQEWGEEEIVQLTELYNEFREATDPLGCIVDRLDVKRPKNRVRQKILELGLAPDSKALRKKRATKSRQQQQGIERSGNPFVNHSSDEELESDSSSDESSKENKSLHKNAASTSKVSSTKRSSHVPNKKVNKLSELNLSAASKFIIQIMNLDMTESLKWLSECLTEAAEDQMQDIDLDDNEGIPLVAISESDVVAMDHSVFKKFLLSIGIKKPASEQEMYWRIPGNMRATDLLKIANVINETIEKGESVNEAPAAVDSESSDEDVFDRLRKIIAKPTETIIDSTQNASENNENSSQETNTKIKEKPKKKNVLEDSDSENENSQQTNKENNSQESNIQSSQGASVQSSQDTSVQSSQATNVQNSQGSKIPSSQGASIQSSRRSSIQSSQESNIQSSQGTNIQSSRRSSIQSSRRSSIQSSQESNSQVSRKTNSDDENSAKNEHIPTSAKKKQSRISCIIDSDESDTDSNSASKRTHHSDSETETNQNLKKMKLTKMLDGSDESEVENEGNISKRTRDSVSESEQKVKRKRIAVIDSDDDE